MMKLHLLLIPLILSVSVPGQQKPLHNEDILRRPRAESYTPPEVPMRMRSPSSRCACRRGSTRCAPTLAAREYGLIRREPFLRPTLHL